MSTIQLDIVTPERLVYSKDVNMVITKAADGDIGIMANHAPMVSTLNTTKVRIQYDDNKQEAVAVSEGFLEVRPDKVTILAEAAELSGEIDELRAQQAKERAEREIREGNGDVAKAELALKRALNRLNAKKF